MIHSVTMPSPVGALGLRVSRDRLLCKIELLPRGCGTVTNRRTEDSVLSDAIRQLGSYFEDPGWCFQLPLAPCGTPFQQRVWQTLQSIPAGETMSYGALAARLSTSARAVGNACRENPIPIIIPCHRIVGARGPGGFMGSRAGEPLAIKKWLLTHESLHGRRKESGISYTKD
uniref:methylated-DNA--[protein]-cysteine S-methyltransferase n=1 Tax=Candidatus Kentrum sp. LPFa TaxID=2126335 RepID=A0A450WCG8_9GAMM|nr:MAG: methylated-DNA-[protein]-cysteine S-methyltransferase [Candidatus Kentron sp. LPFa]